MSEKHKLSIIVCSVKPEMANELRDNVEKTIGIDYEMIVFDNRQTGKGICEVYNECAEKATGEYLLFVHEDVVFHTSNWGEIIVKKLQEPTCGVIGFAGSAVKYGYEYGWQGVRRFTHKNYLAGYKIKGGGLRQSPHTEDFVPVICLDGMCLFARRDVWHKCKFDAHTFGGFHSYDTDFTTQTTLAGYTNYVCHSVKMKHLSAGNFSEVWYDSVKKYLNKWGTKLPLYVESLHSEADIKRYALPTEATALKILIKRKILSKPEAKSRVYGFLKRNPFRRHSYLLLAKYFRRYARE